MKMSELISIREAISIYCLCGAISVLFVILLCRWEREVTTICQLFACFFAWPVVIIVIVVLFLGRVATYLINKDIELKFFKEKE